MPRRRTLLYLIGEPGVGKTTTMRELTSRWRTLATLDDPGRILYADQAGLVAAVELGRRRPGGYSGTDALPMAVIDRAVAHVRSGAAAGEAPLLLAEGARLANRRFLTACRAAGWDVHVAILEGQADAAARRRERGSNQNPSWVAGAATRATRLADDPPPGATVHRVPARWRPAERADALARVLELGEPAEVT